MKETVPTAYTRQQLETVLQKCIADATLDSERPEATKEGWEAFLRVLRDWQLSGLTCLEPDYWERRRAQSLYTRAVSHTSTE